MSFFITTHEKFASFGLSAYNFKMCKIISSPLLETIFWSVKSSAPSARLDMAIANATDISLLSVYFLKASIIFLTRPAFIASINDFGLGTDARFTTQVKIDLTIFWSLPYSFRASAQNDKMPFSTEYFFTLSSSPMVLIVLKTLLQTFWLSKYIFFSAMMSIIPHTSL